MIMDKSNDAVLESCQAMEQGQRVEAAGRDEVNEGAGRVAEKLPVTGDKYTCDIRCGITEYSGL